MSPLLREKVEAFLIMSGLLLLFWGLVGVIVYFAVIQ